jgi:MFS family permease
VAHRPTSADGTAAFATFRPRRGRVVSLTFAILSVVVFGLIAGLLPGLEAGGQWRLGDRLFFLGVGLSIAALLWRYATIRAIPTRESLTIRNLFTTRRVEWQQVVDLRFGGGDPWVTIELDDTDTVAVMAVQKADGPYGRAEASRLAALIQALGPSAASPDVQQD